MRISRRFKRIVSAMLATALAFTMTFSTDVMPLADSKQDQLKAEVSAKQAELDKVNAALKEAQSNKDNDDLTGCFMSIAVLKALKDQNVNLENTEVGVLITGSEEAGLRGAKAFTKAHAKEFDDVETLIFAIDTIRDAKFLGVNVNDLNNTVPSDPHAIDLFFNAGAELGIPVQKIGVPFGATDKFNRLFYFDLRTHNSPLIIYTKH